MYKRKSCLDYLYANDTQVFHHSLRKEMQYFLINLETLYPRGVLKDISEVYSSRTVVTSPGVCAVQLWCLTGATTERLGVHSVLALPIFAAPIRNILDGPMAALEQ